MSDSVVQSMSLFDQRKERMAKTFRREKTDKVPFFLFAENYIPLYAGIDLKKITSYDYAIEIHKNVMDDLQPDSTVTYLPNNLALIPKLSLLGGGAHVVSEDFIKQVNPSATCIMQPQEYPELIKNPTNYLLETVYPRRYKLLANDNAEEKYNNIVQLMMETQKMISYFMKSEEIGQVPSVASGGYYFAPIDIILGLLRNFTGVISDMKRCPELLRDAGLAMVDDIANLMMAIPRMEHAGLVNPMHLPTFIKPKEFEAIYWPSFQKLTEALIAQGHIVFCSFEKNYSHLYDFLQDLPKQRMAGLFNEDDIRVLKRKLGNNMAIFGGLSVNSLAYGTKQECIDHVKALIDDVGRDGGYCITPDLPLERIRDAKPENLKAVSDTILTYGMN